MDKIKVYITDKQTDIKIPTGLRLLIRRCCHAVLVYEKFSSDSEISVSFVSNDDIRKLNKQYRNIDIATDVLSFPMGEKGNYDINAETGCLILGDIVISIEKAFEQARAYSHTIRREVGFLTVHSMLHLLGYDHEKSGIKAAIMREKEEAILHRLGISRASSFVINNEA